MHSQFVKIREIRGRLKIFHCFLNKSLPQTFYKKKDSAIPIAEPFNYCIIKMRFCGE